MAVLSGLGLVMLGMREAATAGAASGSGAPNNDDEDWAWDGRDSASEPRDQTFSKALLWKVVGRW